MSLEKRIHSFRIVQILSSLRNFSVNDLFTSSLKFCGSEDEFLSTTLKLKEQVEWEDFFNDYRLECRQLSEQIAETDKGIDLRVYKLYGLTYDEVLIVDASFGVSREEYES